MKEENPIIILNAISKGFQGKLGYSIEILDKISFDIFPGEFKSILSPQGAGKSTLLKIIAGIHKPDSGNVQEISNEPSSSGIIISYIPSLPSSYPWLSVSENIEFFQKHSFNQQQVSKKDISSLIDIVGLRGYENHHPDNRSLGFRFRISLARSLACNPSLILIDEPFTQMEEKTKEEIYNLLRAVWENTGIAILLATSNIQEAFFLSDSIILLSKRPSRVLEQIRLNLPVKRKIEILNSDYFVEIKSKIDQVYKESELSIKTVLSV